MTTKNLLLATALLEAATGAALSAAPALPVSLLLGEPLETPAAAAIARIAGAALLSLGVVCWFARDDARNGFGLLGALLLYNAAAVGVLAQFGSNHASGPLLWPATALHAGMAVWCVACLRRFASPK